MNMDSLSRILLLLATIFLGIIVFGSQYTGAVKVDQPQFGNVRPAGVAPDGSSIYLFDTNNGNVWLYNLNTGKPLFAGRLAELGQKMTGSQLIPRYGPAL
jgi:hypothetical protein